jgi:toxin-antitoxin system PIN domain toxin
MTFLLDVNVLIALIDPSHVSHDAAHRWFDAEGKATWATCPITENGVIRIVGSPRYPNTPGSTAVVAEIVTRLRALPGHVFWPGDISIVDASLVDAAQVLTSAQVTDTYLLALAVAHGGKLATLDRRLSVKAVRGGKDAFHLIGA